jgi:hypothetical protein
MRKINLSNDLKRDAEVAYGNNMHRSKTIYKTTDGSVINNERSIKMTLETSTESLLHNYNDTLADALVNGDPEIDMEKFGMKMSELKKVYLTPQSKVAYGVTLNEHVYLPDGTEKEVRPESSTNSNISLDGVPIKWTGKLIPKSKAMRMFMFKKSYQVQHINGLTYDFLFDMAKKLSESKSMMLMGGGAKGNEPLVMSNGGTPYRAFLEGRVDGNSYALILRLTNLELKEIAPKS